MSGSQLRLRPGETFGPFRLLAELGRGAAGTVWRVHDGSGRELALKVLLRPESEIALSRFQREGEITARLTHPGIVKVHRSGVSSGWPFLVYELVEGATLEAQVQQLRRRERVQILVQVARAVGHAHAHGVVHRDLKPENVLVDARGTARVADFGAAAAAGLERLTQSGVMVGTPQFMAPEQLTAQRDAWGAPTDVWALGVMLYWALSDTYPFVAESLVALTAQILSTQPTPVHKRDPSITRSLSAVCHRALSTAPEDRYADGNALADDLEAALRGEAVAAPRTSRRGVGAVLVAAIVLGAAGGWLLVGSEPPPRVEVEAEAVAQAEPEPPEAPAYTANHDAFVRGSAALRATLQRADSTEAEVVVSLEGLRELAAECPPETRPELDTPTLDALVAWAFSRVMKRRKLAFEAFAVAAEIGGRVSDRVSTLELLAHGGALVAIDGIDPRRWGELYVAFVQLDMTLGARHSKADYAQYAPTGSDPWSTYMRLRLQQETPEVQFELLGYLRTPPAGFELGPVGWAETAAIVASVLPLEEGAELLREACRRDPASPNAAAALAEHLIVLERYAEAAAAAERAIAIFERGDYFKRLTVQGGWLDLIRLHVRALAKLDQRDEAKAAFARLEAIDAQAALEFLPQWPWLAD